MTLDEALRNKITNLLKLADPQRGGTEGERDNAMAAANRLMAKHNIDAWELATDEERSRGVTHRIYHTKGKTKKWEGMLYHYIGRAIGVKLVYTQSPIDKWAWRWTAIGSDSDLDFLELLYNSLIPWLKSQASQSRKTQRPSNPNAFNRAFFDNAGHIISMRLQHQREELYNATSTGKELVRATDSQNERYAQELFGRLASKKTRGFSNTSGEVAGRQAGSRADISPGRKITSPNRQLNR